MTKKLLVLSAILLLAGCESVGSRYASIWNGAPSAPAQTAPSSLATPPLAPNATQQAALGQPMPPQAVPGMPTPDNLGGMIAPPSPGGQSGPVKVALLVPLSGSHADIGQALLQSAQLAMFDMGSKSFELIPRDTGGTPAGAQKAAESAIADGAQLLLGPLFAAQVKAAAPIAARSGINMIAFSTDWTVAGGNTYIIGFLPFGQVQRIVQYAAAQGVHRIGVMAANDEYGNAVLSAYEREASTNGITTVTVSRFPAGQSDVTGVAQDFIRKTTGSGVSLDAVLMPVSGTQARSITAAFNNAGFGPNTVKRLGTGLWDDTSLAADPGMQGAWFAAPSPDLRRAFEQRYNDTYGQAPPRLATLAYDATALAAVLSRQGSGAGNPFKGDALKNPNGFAGIDGVFRFLPSGLAERGLGVLTFRNNMIAVQDPAPRTFQGWQNQ